MPKIQNCRTFHIKIARFKNLAFLSFLFFFPVFLGYATTLNVDITEHPHASVVLIGGSTQTNFPMLKMTLSATGGDVSVTSLVVTNNGDLLYVTASGQDNGIVKVTLYQDTKSSSGGTSPGVFGTDDILIGSLDPDSGLTNAGSASFTGLSVAVDEGGSETLFLLYDLGGNSANLGKTANGGVDTGSITHTADILNLNNNNRTKVTLAGGVLNSVEDISSAYLFRGEDPAAVLKVSLSLSGELMENIRFTLSNAQGNFHSTIFEKVSIYEDHTSSGTQGSFDADNDILRDPKTVFPDPADSPDAPTIEFSVTSGNSLSTGNYIFYVVYDVKSDCPIGTQLQAQVTSMQVTGKTSGETETVLGTLPGPTSPAETDVIDTYTLTLSAVQVELDHAVYQGSTKVPVLAFTLKKLAAALGDSVSIKISNEGSCPFSSLADGISRVWLYQDNPASSGAGEYDGQDLLVSTTTEFTNNGKDVVLSDVQLVLNESTTFFVLYDVGLTSSGTFNARIDDIPSPETIYMATSLPHSLIVSQNVIASPLTIISVTSNVSIINSQTTQNMRVTLNIQNNASVPLRISSVGPTWYENTIHGQDRSAEYLLQAVDTYPLTVNPGNVDLAVEVSTDNISTEGTYLLDGRVSFVSQDITATTVRYPFSSGQYGRVVSGDPIYWQVEFSREQQSWDVPAHVLSVNMVYLSASQAFESGDPVKASAQLKIYFNRNVIDESSFQVLFGDVSCQQVIGDPASIYEYQYDADQGLLTTRVPTASGQLTVRLFDKAGESLDSLELTIAVPEQIQISNILLYPNPFPVNGSTTLVFSFSLNKAADVDFYLANAGGDIVWSSKDNAFESVGYNEYRIWTGLLNSGDYLASGIYSVWLIARDSDGNKAMAKAKLAVR